MALRVNPGGTLDPSQVYDRTALIARLWRTLDNQSVYLTAERRMGKTSVVNKMLAAPPEGVQVISCDLEKVGSPAQLVEELLLAISDKLPHLLRARSWLSQSLKALGIAKLTVAAIGGVEFRQSVEPHWQSALDRVLGSLERVHGRLVVVFLDEVAYGLDSVARATTTADARAILDHFRAVRQAASRVRFVYTSSVGLHHVIDTLGADAGSWAPINDMAVVDVGPFSADDAVGLALSLVEGESLETADARRLADEIAAASEGVPYWVHHIVRGLRDVDRPDDPKAVEAVVRAGLEDPYDGWGFDHYVERLADYYGDDAPLVADVLDLVATSGPLDFDGLWSLLRGRREVYDRDRERVRRLIDLLQKDHYLIWVGDSVRFRFVLLARAWVVRRHLEAQ